jgi:hypothetical protein
MRLATSSEALRRKMAILGDGMSSKLGQQRA